PQSGETSGTIGSTALDAQGNFLITQTALDYASWTRGIRTLKYDPGGDLIWSNNVPLGPNVSPVISAVRLSQNETVVVDGYYLSTATNAGWMTATLLQNAPPGLPVIHDAPRNGRVKIGNSFAFVSSATGSPPIYYQWLFNGAVLAGATNSTLFLTNVA